MLCSTEEKWRVYSMAPNVYSMVAAKGQDFISAALQEVGGGGGHWPDHAEQCAAIDQFCNAVHV